MQQQTVRWNDFAKRVLDIPEIQFVVNTHGIFFEKGMLSLVQEHVPCQTLQNFQETFKWNNSPFSLLRVTRFIMDIVKGMEFIHSYGFLHPGLSLRKVLLTEKGYCKLYDFSLSLDATNRIIFLKSKVTQSLNTLPLESWQRNEYTQESDIWTLAVIIWQLLSSGTSPFSCEQTEYANLENMLITPTTSDQGLKIGNDILLKCWEKNSSLRPSLSQLRSSFERIMSSAKASSEETDSTNSYIPMVGNVKGNSGN
ncbi:Hepatocyte growth factor receptor [Holothuria leucospilota]|uniref:Hepatocyte growth factor receptor n=1 Tax=Holothuria leucospilota TaxID=206669 RepID=A0A9Q0YAH7_HOLLE|nr:Hepatocyte growth factor receptor [Holothuria leucospilota]